MMNTQKTTISARSGGFTLIELIIVVVILGIAAVIAVPMLSSAGDMQVRSAANRIAADLEYAKSMAMTHQEHYWVVFDTVNETYQIQNASGVIDSSNHPSGKYVVNFKTDSRLSRVNIATAVFNNVTFSTVAFDYLGSPYAKKSTATDPLNTGKITLQDDTGTYSIDVEIEPMTGYVTITGQ